MTYERMSDPKVQSRRSRTSAHVASMFAGWRSVPSEASASAESDAELSEGGLSVRTYTENFCCSYPDEAREAMGRYQGTPGGSVILYIHPSHALRPEDRTESVLR